MKFSDFYIINRQLLEKRSVIYAKLKISKIAQNSKVNYII